MFWTYNLWYHFCPVQNFGWKCLKCSYMATNILILKDKNHLFILRLSTICHYFFIYCVINSFSLWSLVFVLCLSFLLIFIRLHCIRRCSLLLLMEQRGLPVGLSVMIWSPAKTAEPIELLFGLWTWVGQRNHVFDGGPDPPWKGRGQFWGGGNTIHVRQWCGLLSNYFDYLFYPCTGLSCLSNMLDNYFISYSIFS